MIITVVSLISFAVSFSLGTVIPTAPFQIESGLIRGKVENVPRTNFKVIEYLGIPYAKAERFERPKPPGNWTGTKDMFNFGDSCIGISYNRIRNFKGFDENCLYLNVYVPAKRCRPFPVIVWLHGGSFVTNSGKDEDGKYLATMGNSIVVTVNFRLGIFGYFFGDRGPTNNSNNGLYDQLEALKWVKRNIASFRGDPTRVTLMGTSSGSISASLLSLSPLADSYFNNVILMSGFVNPFLCTWNQKRFFDISNPLFTFFQKILSNKCNAKCLKRVSLQKWSDEQKPMFDDHLRWFFPYVDGTLIPDEPEILLKKGIFKKRNILIGVNNQDGSLLTNVNSMISGGERTNSPLEIDILNGVTRAEFVEALQKLLAITLSSKKIQQVPVDQVVNHYYKINANAHENILHFIKMLTDALFRYPALKMANAFSAKKNADVFFYELEHRPRLKGERSNVPSIVKAIHSSESSLVFGNAIEENKNQADVLLSKQVIQMWTNFAKTGEPTTHAGNFVWKKYTNTSPGYLAIKPQMKFRKQAVLDTKSFQLLDKIFGEMIDGSGVMKNFTKRADVT